MTASKYAKIGTRFPDTAYRDINRLIELGALPKAKADGRRSGYCLLLGEGRKTQRISRECVCASK